MGKETSAIIKEGGESVVPQPYLSWNMIWGNQPSEIIFSIPCPIVRVIYTAPKKQQIDITFTSDCHYEKPAK
jgi:hypothetical protein